MTRLLAVLGVWSIVAFGLALANPARPLYEPVPPAKLPAVKALPNMMGTTWQGKYSVSTRFYTFEPDGTVSYAINAKSKPNKGRGNWRFEGQTFIFDHNLGAATVLEFRGTFKDGNTLVGQQTMVKTGAKSNVTMQRSAP